MNGAAAMNRMNVAQGIAGAAPNEDYIKRWQCEADASAAERRRHYNHQFRLVALESALRLCPQGVTSTDDLLACAAKIEAYLTNGATP